MPAQSARQRSPLGRTRQREVPVFDDDLGTCLAAAFVLKRHNGDRFSSKRLRPRSARYGRR
jgi:hypothetical protein